MVTRKIYGFFYFSSITGHPLITTLSESMKYVHKFPNQLLNLGDLLIFIAYNLNS